MSKEVLKKKKKRCRKKKFQQQWLQFDHLKPNQLFQVTLESHHHWNIPGTDDVLKLCSGVWFQEYTQR